MSEKKEPTAAPTEAPAPAPAPGAPASAPPVEETISLTTSQLNDRMERARRALVKKELGVDDLDAAKAKLARLAELEKGEEERKRAALSEQEKLQADLTAERAARAKAEAAAEQARVDLHLSRLFAKHGIRNADYATFCVMNRLNALGETEELDEEAFVQELLKNPRERIALGLDEPGAAAAPPTLVQAPPTTTSTPGTAPKPPPVNPAVAPKSAYDLDPQSWAKRKAELGIG